MTAKLWVTRGQKSGSGQLRIDEGQQQRFAAKLIEMDRMAILIDETEVGYLVARRRDVILHCGPVIRLGQAGDHEVIYENRGV